MKLSLLSPTHCIVSSKTTLLKALLPLRALGIVMILLFSVTQLMAQTTYYSRASAAWAVNTTWSTVGFASATNAGTFPVAGDIVNIGGGFTVTVGAAAACATLTINDVSAASALSVGAFALTVSGTTTIGGGFSGSNLTITSATGTKTFTGAVTINSGGSFTESAAATLVFGSDVTIGGTITESAAAVVGIAGNLTNNGTYTASTGVHTFSGTAKTFSGTSTTTIGSVAISGTYTNNGALSVTTALSGAGSLTNASGKTLALSGTCSVTTLANAGIINNSGTGATTTVLANFTNTGTINISGSGTITGITNSAGGTVNHSGSSTITSFNNAASTSVLNISTTPTVPTFTTLTLTASGNTVNYNGAGAQTVQAGVYSNLILSGSGVKSLLTGTAVTTNLSIMPSGSSATASIATGVILNVKSLSFADVAQTSATSWGSTTSAATNKINTYFAATTGYLKVNMPITSTATGGDWATTTTWVGGVVPAATDPVVIATTGAGSVTTAAGTITCGGLTINSLAILTMTRPFIVNGSTSITGRINFGSTNTTVRAMTFNGDVTLISGATWDETNGGANTVLDTYTFTSSFSNNASTFTTLAGSAHNFNGAAMTIAGTSSLPLCTVNGTYTNNGTLSVTTTLSGAGTLTNASTLNISGTATIGSATGGLNNSGTITITGAGAISTLLAGFTNTGTINLSGSGTIAGVTNNAAGIVNLNSSGTITNFDNISTSTLNISASAVPTITTFNVSSSGNTVNYSGTGAQTVINTNYHHLGFSGARVANSITINGALGIAGNLTSSATFSGGTFVLTGSTFTLNGTGAQSLNSLNGVSFPTLTINKASGTATLGSAIASTVFNLSGAGSFDANGWSHTVSGLATLSAGIYLAGAATQTFNGGLTISGGTFTGAGGAVTTTDVTLSSGVLTAPSGTFSVSGNWAKSGGTFTPGSNTVTFTKASVGTQTLNSGGSSFYNISHSGTGVLQLLTSALTSGGTFSNATGAGNFDANGLAHTVSGLTTLTAGSYLAGAATQSFNGGLTINGGTFTGAGGTVNTTNLVLSSGTLTAPSTTFNVSGNWSLTSGATFTHNSGTVSFNAGTGHAINGTGATTFNNLTLNDVAGLSLSSAVNATVLGTLTFTTGVITTNSNYLILGSAGSAGTVSRTLGHVNGFLRKYIPNTSAPTVNFEVGGSDNATYTPVSLVFVGTTASSGYIDASTTATAPPFVTGLSQSKYIMRDWTITNNGVTGFTSYSPTFTFVAGDKSGTPNTASLVIRQYNGSTWLHPTIGTQATLSTQSTGIAIATGFGKFAIGEDACLGTDLWLGGTPSFLTDWATGSNWCSGSAPTASDNVQIAAGATYYPVIGLTAACNNISIDAGATLTISGSNILNVSGNWTKNASATFTANTSIVNFNGSLIQSINGATTFSSLKINSAGGVTLAAAITASSLTIGDVTSSSIFNDGGFQITGGSGTLTLSNSATFKLGNGSTATTFPTFTTNTLTSGTVDFASSNSQTIPAINYNTVTNTGGGARTLASGTVGISGTFTPGGGAYTVTGNTLNFNGSGSQTIPAINYNNLSSTNNTRVLASSGTIGIAGTFTPGSGSYTITGSTVQFNGASQTVPAFNYNNLDLSTATTAITFAGSGTIGIAGTFTAPGVITKTISGSTINFNGSGTQTIPALNYNNLSSTNNTRVLASSGTIGIAGTFTPGSGSYTSTGSTVQFNGASQTVPALNYNNLDLSAATTAITLASSGTIGIAGTFTVPGAITQTITGSTLDFNGGTQTIPAFTYNNLSSSNSGTKTLGGAITVNTVLTVGASSTLDLSSTSLSLAGGGTPLVISGALTPSASTVNYTSSSTTNIAAANYNNLDGTGGNRTLPNGGTVGINGTFTVGAGSYTVTGSTVDFNGSATQSINSITYNNLTIGGSGLNNKTAAGNITVNGILNLSNVNYSASQGVLDMSTYTLSMGASATTTGQGDVTGIVKRSSFVANTPYSFGNQFTTLNLGTGGTFDVSVKLILTNPSVWKPSAINRYYDIITSVPASTIVATLNLHYLPGELNGNTVGDMDLFDYHVGGLVDDHGRSNDNATDHWVGLTNVTLGYIGSPGDWNGKYFTLGTSLTGSDHVWLSTPSNNGWNNAANWSGGIPSTTDDHITIPTSTIYPIFSSSIPSSASIGKLTILAGATLYGGTGTTLTINGASGAWENNGTFNAETSTVVFVNAAATMTDPTNFNNLTIQTGATLTLGTGNVMLISGTLSRLGTLDAASHPNSIEYNGTAQTVVNPDGPTAGYSTLILSGSGVKTMPGGALSIGGNFSMSGTASATALAAVTTAGNFSIGSGTSFTAGSFTHGIAGNFSNSGTFDAGTSTFSFNGSSGQTISGSTPVAFNNFTLNNAAGLSLSGVDATVNGVLTFTNGKIASGSNTFILGNAATVTDAGAGKYVFGKLRKGIATSSTTKTFEIGNATSYLPVSIDFTGGTTNGTGSITCNTTDGQHPNYTTSGLNQTKYINRYWTIDNSGVTFSSTYDATFTFADPGDLAGSATPSSLLIKKYSGSTWSSTTTGTSSSTTVKTTGNSTFSDFASGEAFVSNITDYFRSAATGNWSSASTWESSADGNIWGPASSAPTSSATSITIQSGHTVTIDATATASNLSIVGTLTSGAYNLSVNGSWSNTGTFTVSSGTVTFNGTTTISGASTNSFNNLTITGTLTAPAATINVAGNWANTGTFNDNGGTVVFNGTSAQTLSNVNTFNNLTINNTAGVVASANQTVNGTLYLESINPGSGTFAALAMTDPYVLYMGSAALTTGNGDVSGYINRSTFALSTNYTFGNPNTLINFTVGPLPTSVTLEVYLTGAPAWKTGAIKRYYDITRSGGSPATRLRFNIHYLSSELNSNTDGNLDFFDFHTTPSPVVNDHGRSDYSTTAGQEWVGFANVGLVFLGTNLADNHLWTLATREATNCTWIGGSPSGPTDWDLPGNWDGGVPGSTSSVVLPGGTAYHPLLPDAVRTISTINIQSGGELNADVGTAPTLTIDGASNAWINNGGLNAGSSSTIIFTNAAATIAGSTDFNNLTISSGATLTPATGNVMRIAGSLSGSGTLNATSNVNTIEYNGTAQTIFVPSGTPATYSSLILSGSGTKTMPNVALTISADFSMTGTATATALQAITTTGNFTLGNGTTFVTGSIAHIINGNFSNSGTFTAAGSTVTFSGSSGQGISGSSATTFNNLTLSNSSGIALSGSVDATVSGTLHFTAGKITTNANRLILGSANNAGTISGVSSSTYIYGNLRRYVPNGVTQTVNYDIGDAAYWTPVSVSFAGTTSGSGYLEASTLAAQPPVASGLSQAKYINRKWTVSNPANNLAFTSTYSPTFTFDASDKVGLSTYSNLVVRKLDASTWTSTTNGTRENLSTTCSGLSSFSDFYIGEQGLDHFVLALVNPQANATAFAGTNTLTAEDALNQTITNFDASANNVTISANSPFTGAVSGIHSGATINLLADFTSGVADLTALGMKYTGNSGTGTFTATSGTKTGNSGSVTIDPGPLTNFLVESAAGGSIGTQTAGTSFNIKVTARDASNNTVTSYDGSGYTVGISSSGTLSSGSGTTAEFVSGVLASHSVTINPGAASVTLTATRTSGSETGTSSAFTVDNPVPAISDISPGTQCAGGSGFTLTVNGSNFITSSVVNIGGSARTTTYVNTGQLTAAILSGDISSAGTPAITVVNTTPAGGTSSSVPLTVNAIGTWTGAVNNDWNTAGNWCGGIPTASTDVIIPLLVNQPIIGVAGGVCNDITLQNDATLEISSTYGLTVSGNWSNSGTLYANSSTVTFNGSGKSISGASATTFYNLSLSGTASVTTAAPVTIGGNLAIGNGTTFTAAAYALTITGTTTIGGGTSGSLIISSATGAKTFNGLVTVSDNGTWTNTGNSAVSFHGGITNSATGTTFTAGSGVYTFETNAQALTGTLVIPNVTVTGITLTNNNTLTVSTSLAGTGGLTQGAAAQLFISGTSGIANINATTFGNLVEFTGSSQTVYATSYYNLYLTSSSTSKTFVGTTSISNVFIIASGVTVSANTRTIDIGSVFNNSGTFNPETSTVVFNGSSGQLMGGATSFNNLTVNTAGGLSLSVGVTVNGVLTLTSGILTLGSSNLTLGSAAVAGTPGASKMIVATGTGECRRVFTTSGSYTFPVGDADGTAEYSPITLNFTSGTYSSAYAGIKVKNVKHPNNASATNYLSRYWTVTSTGISSFSCDVTGTYVPADIVGTEGSIKAAKYSGTLPWLKYSALASNTLSAPAVSGFSDFTGITSAAPSVTISADPSISVCKDGSLTLTANPTGDPTFTYLWSSGGATSASINPSTATPGSTTYYVTATDGNGIQATGEVTVTVKVLPTATIDGNGGAICTNGNATFNITGTSGATLTYTLTGGSETITLTGSSQTLTVNGATTEKTLTLVSVTDGTCPNTLSATSTVTVNALPTASITGNGGTICSGGNATFNITGTSGATLTYT
ncbi:MAG: hypothetical protein WCO63_04805, partial [Bacteroidota bacterium]